MNSQVFLLLSIAAIPVAAQAPAKRATLPDVVVPLIATVRSGTSLGTWRAAHSGDTASSRTNNYTACQVMTHGESVDGEIVRIEVAFFIPPTPAVLPLNVPAAALRDQCQAGMVTVSFYDADRSNIATREAVLEHDPAVGRLIGPLAVGSASPSGNSNAASHDDSVAIRTSVAGNLFTAIIGARRTALMDVKEWQVRRRDRQDPAPGDSWIDSLIREASIGGMAGRRVREAFDTRGSVDSLVATLKPWLRAARPLPSARRAAALAVADSLLRMTDMYITDSPSAASASKFAVLGVTITLRHDEEFGDYLSYDNGLARRAFTAAPTSRAGQIAFLHVIAPAGSCYVNTMPIVTRINAYLRQYPNSPIRRQLDELAGRAASAALVSFAGDSGGRQGELARRAGIDAYADAFALSAPDRRAGIWNEIFLLLARNDIAGYEFFECE